jgi:isopentenyl phosphate kinase
MAFSTSGTLGVEVSATPTTAEFDLGTRVTGTDGTEWVYVQASGAITQYDAVGIDEDYQAAALTKAIADDGHAIGFAQVAFADNDYGWVATRGSNISVRLAANCAADVALYTTATAGVLDDASTSQTNIDGVVAVAGVTTAGSDEVIATFPRSTTF